MLPRTADQEPHSANPCPGNALSEKAHFPQYWPFWSNSRRTAVNQKRLEFVVEMFGSPNEIRTQDLSVSTHHAAFSL